jgi:hypothetical protein
MRCVAHFEVKSHCSVIDDDRIVRIEHPEHLFKVTIRNLPRKVFTTPFLLSVQIYFDDVSLDTAKERSQDLLADVLNMLTFCTGAKFERHRIRHVVDVTQPSGMRQMLMWSDRIQYEDPQPFLEETIAAGIEKLLSHAQTAALRRALRWYRLGVCEPLPDDQFTFFWFALELLAEAGKGSDKVHDRCPKCKAALYCESCKDRPMHRPYGKQAIAKLLESVGCSDEETSLLDRVRNSLMHGSTLKEIEESLPKPHEQVVDLLGRNLWRALIGCFPKELFDGSVAMGYPNTYIYRTAVAVAHIETVVPRTTEGEFDLRAAGPQITVEPFGPPQSALPFVVALSDKQVELLGSYRRKSGEYKDTCDRIYKKTRKNGDVIRSLVLATDVDFIKKIQANAADEEVRAFLLELVDGASRIKP